LLSAITFFWNTQTVMLEWRYDEHCKHKLKEMCPMKIIVTSKVDKGSILFLKLKGFRQNDRRY